MTEIRRTRASSAAELADADHRKNEFLATLAHNVTTLPPPRPGRRILVVDDNVDSVDSLAILLRLQGHHVAVAHDGLEAVEMAVRTLPEVVLLDIGLPGLNGYDAARRIRQSPGGSAMQLIAVTGWGQEEDRKLAHAAGFDEHLVKPIRHDRLIALLAQPWRPPTAVVAGTPS